ncbi:MAG TPA: IS110 family transposase [Nocardioidaceae bacterium]|nr:IS110 family transposase [Nocardioidaceae bacterium]
MRRIHDRVAGLDVHRDSVVACVELFEGTSVEIDKATFSTTAAGVRELGEWLAVREVELVVMEATGVYWRPIFYGLEDRFDELWLVNAHHVKNVPGRKTDMSDAEWLADVAAHGMVRPSFVPPPEIRGLRELTRYRKTQIRARGQEIQRLEKLLQDAGIKLTSVASKVWSQSSRAMVEMLIAGETDPAVLAELAKGRMRPKIPALVEALESRWVAHHSTVARQILAHIDFLDDTIETLTAEIVERVVPFEAAVELLKTIPGVNELTAQTMIAEIGVDMSRFPTAGHLAAWAGVAPASHESAGKRRPAGTRHGSRHLRDALIEAARAAARTKGTFLSARYSRIARRRGPNKAAVAIAHSILVAAHHMLTTGEIYQDLGADFYDKRIDPARKVRRHISELEAAGYTVTLTPAA